MWHYHSCIFCHTSSQILNYVTFVVIVIPSIYKGCIKSVLKMPTFFWKCISFCKKGVIEHISFSFVHIFFFGTSTNYNCFSLWWDIWPLFQNPSCNLAIFFTWQSWRYTNLNILQRLVIVTLSVLYILSHVLNNVELCDFCCYHDSIHYDGYIKVKCPYILK